jgi:hypothetical protein
MFKVVDLSGLPRAAGRSDSGLRSLTIYIYLGENGNNKAQDGTDVVLKEVAWLEGKKRWKYRESTSPAYNDWFVVAAPTCTGAGRSSASLERNPTSQLASRNWRFSAPLGATKSHPPLMGVWPLPLLDRLLAVPRLSTQINLYVISTIGTTPYRATQPPLVPEKRAGGAQ